jgi:hypothetical protein
LDQLGDGWNGSKLPALDVAAAKNRSNEEEQGFHIRKVGSKLGYNKWIDITLGSLFSRKIDPTLPQNSSRIPQRG